mmetsp:Transcript_11086/g.25413  ORF Transcript_11086/g.25413 Transcript_11086/m.25413 type:complete len:305 (+) Transcript_11086:91-1005(+)
MAGSKEMRSLAPAAALVGTVLCLVQVASGGLAFTSAGTALQPRSFPLGSGTPHSHSEPVISPGDDAAAGSSIHRMLGGTAMLLVLAAARVAPAARSGRGKGNRVVACEVSMRAATTKAVPETFCMDSADVPVTVVEEAAAAPVADLIDFASAPPALPAYVQPVIQQSVLAGASQPEATSAPAPASRSARRAGAARWIGSARSSSRSRRPGVARHAAAAAAAKEERRCIGARLQTLPAAHFEQFALSYDCSVKSLKIQLGLRNPTRSPCTRGREAKTPSCKKSSGTRPADFMGNHIIEQIRTSKT